MQFSTIAAALAFAASAFAQTAGFDPITKPVTGEIVNAGTTYTIVWQSTVNAKITLSLIGGETPATLVDRGTIATGVDSSAGQFPWAVNSTLGTDKTYGIKITLESDPTTFQFGFPFAIKPVGTASSSSAASSGYPTSAASSSAASSAASSSSSYSATSYPVTSSYSAKSTSTYSFSTFSSAGNLSTTVTPTTVTSFTTATASTTASRTSTTSVQTAAANSVVAGSLALVGGIAAAIFAL